MTKIECRVSPVQLWFGIAFFSACALGAWFMDAGIAKWFAFACSLTLVIIGIWTVLRFDGRTLESDDLGIQYRRYFLKWKTARWEEIEWVSVIDSHGKTIRLSLLSSSGKPETAIVGLGWTKEHFSICEKLLLNAIEARLKLQPDGSTTINQLDNLTAIYWLQKRYSEAISNEEKVLCICEETLGTQHARTAETLLYLANLAMEMKQNEKALDYSKRATTIFERVSGTFSSDYVASLEMQSNVLKSFGRHDEANRLETSRRQISKSVPKSKTRPDIALILVHALQISFIGFLFTEPIWLNPEIYFAKPIATTSIDSVANSGQIVRMNLRTTNKPAYVTPSGEKLALVMLELVPKQGRNRHLAWTSDVECTDESGKILLRCERVNDEYLKHKGGFNPPFIEPAVPPFLKQYINKDVAIYYVLMLPCNTNVVAYAAISREDDGSYRMNPPRWLPLANGVIVTAQNPSDIARRANTAWFFCASLASIVAIFCYGRLIVGKLKQLVCR
jgi:tetratricopeptide (TPR) repeat protein